jgi:tetratricopeptide (TPR) repeat protein
MVSAQLLGKDDAFALCWAGYSLAFVVGEFDDGAAFMDRALALNPNLARAWHRSGWVRIWVAKPEMAIEHLAHAMRLSPLDPTLFDMQTAAAYAHFYLGRYEEALSPFVVGQIAWISQLAAVVTAAVLARPHR